MQTGKGILAKGSRLHATFLGALAERENPWAALRIGRSPSFERQFWEQQGGSPWVAEFAYSDSALSCDTALECMRVRVATLEGEQEAACLFTGGSFGRLL